MDGEPHDLTYEEWLTWIFSGQATESGCGDADTGWWDEGRDPNRTAEYLTRLFEDPVVLLPRFGDEQISKGLDFLVNPAFSNTMHALVDEAVPWERQERCIRVIAIVYRELFARKCTVHFAHLEGLFTSERSLSQWLVRQWPGRFAGRDIGPDEPNPLNGICYMWWDVCPLPHNASPSNSSRTFAAVLEVLGETLRIQSPACQEGALHGLGHLQHYRRREVEEIIDEFLQREERLHPALREYAPSARTGSVL